MLISQERLMLTADDKVVREGDPRARKLLVAKGGELSTKDALKYGLINDPHATSFKLPDTDVALSIEEVDRELTPGEKAAEAIAASVPSNIGGANEASKVATGAAVDQPPANINAPPAPAPSTAPKPAAAPAKPATAAPAGMVPTAPPPAPAPAPAATPTQTATPSAPVKENK